MIRSVVHHEDSCPAPLRILGIEMSTQLGQKESIGVLVGNANVDCIEQLTSAAESSNHIETTDFASGGDLVLLVFLHPSVLAMVCEPDDRLVNVNDSMAAVQKVDKLGSRELSLELSSSIVLDELDRFDLAIRGTEFTPQVSAKPWATNLQLALGHELLLEVTQLKWPLRCVEQLANNVTSSLVELLEPRSVPPTSECSCWVEHSGFTYSPQEAVTQSQSLRHLGNGNLALGHEVVSLCQLHFTNLLLLPPSYLPSTS
jgi:hypothetical protein